METAATTITATITSNRSTRSLCLAKYIKNIQQANKKAVPLTKAIFVPSGDQLGFLSKSRLLVNLVGLVPSHS
jgi:hypothetical protein